ncbi:MAG: methylmalonyl-CoA mutase [Caulobacteraceae bacterium]|nr:methylmalonyl-CoA mutase [Caulobacteraceae bacterium]
MSRAIEPAVLPLAEGFAAAGRPEWLTLVEKTLKGAPLESLVRRTLEGIPIQPLYEQAKAAPGAARDLAGWDIRTLVRNPEPAAANAEVLQDLAGGANSVLVRIGQGGVAAGSAEALARVLEGALLDVATVALDAGFLGAKAADWLGAAAKGAPAAPLALHMDPLSAFAEAGASPGPIEAHLIACAGVGARLAEPYPKASLFLASGRVAHESGAGEALELAVALAAALAYAKALVRAGLGVQEAFERIVLGLSLDADYFITIAKLRAARVAWARLAGACGADAPASIEARSSGRMLARADAWTNMIRLTAASFAGAVGGADAVALGTFTDALGLPTAFARRQARNAQLVLQEEANLGRVVDPAAGCGYLESLTDDLARAAWAQFQAIEAAGGIVRALEGGLVARETEAARTELAARIGRREVKILGVTDFAPQDERPPAVASAPAAQADGPAAALPGPASRCPPLAPIRLEELA